MIAGILILWFSLTLLSLIYITYDLTFVTPEASVMKVGWWLVTLYTGPVGLFFYLLSCKEPMPGTHEVFIKPLWKQSLGSMVHCLAGDVTGIIIAALVLTFFSESIPIEILIEYLAGFVFGFFIFQSLFMKKMMGGTYWKALKTSFYPELVSMNMIMTGMIPVMVMWNLIEPSARDPLSMHFWGKMSLATVVAGITAFGMNRWLVKTGLKHGMMTIRKSESNHKEMHHEHMQHKQGHEHQIVSVSSKKLWEKFIFSCLWLGCGVLISIGAWALKNS